MDSLTPEMAGWHHGLDGLESEWTPGVGDGQGGLVCCDSWDHKELDTTERLNWIEDITSPSPPSSPPLLVLMRQEMQEMQAWSLDQDNSLEEEMAAYPSIFAWKISWTEEPDRLRSMGSQRIHHDWPTEHTCNWQRCTCLMYIFGWICTCEYTCDNF